MKNEIERWFERSREILNVLEDYADRVGDNDVLGDVIDPLSPTILSRGDGLYDVVVSHWNAVRIGNAVVIKGCQLIPKTT